MALPDYIQNSLGTAIVFGEATASGVTHRLDCNGLANGTAQQSAYADLGANFETDYLVEFAAETGTTAPTAGNTLDLYLLSSNDTASWPAKATGSAGAYTLGTSDANLRQAGAAVSVLIATADSNTVLRQAPVVWRPRGRYVVALLDNNLGQALRSEATAANNDTRITLTPLRTLISE